jgi:steroid delta-isomerase-like uncharacterized protein
MLKDIAAQTDKAGIAAWNDHDSRAFAALFAQNFIWEDVTMPGQPMRTVDEAVAYTQAWFTGFPDMEVVQTRQIVNGDGWVCSTFEFTGTNMGPLNMGGGEIPATNRTVNGRGCYFAHVTADGEIDQFITYPDVFGMMAQLGLIPS